LLFYVPSPLIFPLRRFFHSYQGFVCIGSFKKLFYRALQNLVSLIAVNKEVNEPLKDQIINGAIQPGKQITIREIASKFSVSTMPVRKAIRRLQAEGLQFENRCETVRKLNLEDLQQIFVMRQRLETLAIEWASPIPTIISTPCDM
jgi:DNA-binding GntR family transcriptional regulator